MESTSRWTWSPAATSQRNLDIAAVEGRVVTISLLGGSRAEINMGMILTKRLTLTGSTLRSRTVAQKAAVADAVRRNVWPLAGRGPGATGDLRHVSAGRGERSASAHGDFEAYRQDRAHRLGDPSGFTANKRTRLSDSD